MATQHPMVKSDRDRISFAPGNYWSVPFDSLIAALKSNIEGLSRKEVEERLSKFGPNTLETKRGATPVGLFLGLI
jgi:magnesium-transporting ATPase (P-type)